MNYLITLCPQKELFDKINEIKNQAKEIVGDQLYLKDEPHITVYIGVFENDEFFNKLDLKKLNEIELDGWKVFRNDPITGNDTLTIGIVENSKLRKFQENVVKDINKFRVGTIKRYNQVNGLTDTEEENLKKYGFPYVGDNWHAHLGIASFKPQDFNLFWEKIRGVEIKGKYEISSINLYELKEDESLTFIKKIELNK